MLWSGGDRGVMVSFAIFCVFLFRFGVFFSFFISLFLMRMIPECLCRFCFDFLVLSSGTAKLPSVFPVLFSLRPVIFICLLFCKGFLFVLSELYTCFCVD